MRNQTRNNDSFKKENDKHCLSLVVRYNVNYTVVYTSQVPGWVLLKQRLQIQLACLVKIMVICLCIVKEVASTLLCVNHVVSSLQA